MAVGLAPSQFKCRTSRLNRSCCFSPRWIIFSTLFIYFAQIPGTYSKAQVYINFWTYNNPELLTANSSCCSSELQDGSCASVCSYTIEVCLGISESLPCDLYRDNVGFFSVQEMPVNLTNFVANPVSFGLTKWQDSMLATIYVNDSTTHGLVDLMQLLFNTPTPATRPIDSTDYTQLNLTGNGLSQPSTMTMSLAVTCDRNYYTDTCELYCQDSDTCDGHYNCDPVTGTRQCLSGWEGSYCNISQINGLSCSDAVESIEPRRATEITTAKTEVTPSLELTLTTSIPQPSQDRNDTNTILAAAETLAQDDVLVKVSSVHTMMSQLTLSPSSTTENHISTLLAASIDSTMFSLSNPDNIFEGKETVSGTTVAVTNEWDSLTLLSNETEITSFPTTLPEIRSAADQTPPLATSTVLAANETLDLATLTVAAASETMFLATSKIPAASEPPTLATLTAPAASETIILATSAVSAANETPLLATSMTPAANETLFLSTSTTPNANETLFLSTSTTPNANESTPLATSIVPAASETPPLATLAAPVASETPPLATSTVPVTSETPPLATSVAPAASEIPPLATSTVPVASETPPLATSTLLAAYETLAIGTLIVPAVNETPPLATSATPAANETLFLATSTVSVENEILSSVASTQSVANETMFLATLSDTNEALLLAASSALAVNETPTLVVSAVPAANETMTLFTSSVVDRESYISSMRDITDMSSFVTMAPDLLDASLHLTQAPDLTEIVSHMTSTPALVDTTLSVTSIPELSGTLFVTRISKLTATESMVASTQDLVGRASFSVLTPFESFVTSTQEEPLLIPTPGLASTLSFVPLELFDTTSLVTSTRVLTDTMSFVISTPGLTDIMSLVTSTPGLTDTMSLVTSTPGLNDSMSFVTSTPRLNDSMSLVTSTLVLTDTMSLVTSTPVLTDTMSLVTSTPGLTDTMSLVTSTPGLTDTMSLVTSTPVLTDTMSLVTSTPGLTDTMSLVTSTPVLTDTMSLVTSTPGLTDTMSLVSSTPMVTDAISMITPTADVNSMVSFITWTQVASILQSTQELTDTLPFLTATTETNETPSSFTSVSSALEIWPFSLPPSGTTSQSSIVFTNEISSSLAGSVSDSISITSSAASNAATWDSGLSVTISTQSNTTVPAETYSLPFTTSSDMWIPMASGGTSILAVSELSSLATTPAVAVSSSLMSLETTLSSLTPGLGVTGASSMIFELSTSARLSFTPIQELTFRSWLTQVPTVSAWSSSGLTDSLWSSLTPLPTVNLWSSSGQADSLWSTLTPVPTITAWFSSGPAEGLWPTLTQPMSVSIWSSLTTVTLWSSSAPADSLWSSLTLIPTVTLWSSSAPADSLWSSLTLIPTVTLWSSSAPADSLWSSLTLIPTVTLWSSSAPADSLWSSLTLIPTVTLWSSSVPTDSLWSSLTLIPTVTLWSSSGPAESLRSLLTQLHTASESTSLTQAMNVSVWSSITAVPDTATLISLTTAPDLTTVRTSSTLLSISATFPSHFSNQLTVPTSTSFPAMFTPLDSAQLTSSLFTSTAAITKAIFPTSTAASSYLTMTTTIADTTTTTTAKPSLKMGELFIAGPVAVKDYTALLQIVREALMAASQPAFTCCLSVVTDDSAFCLDADGNPLLRFEYTISPPAGSDPPNVDRNAMIVQINGRLNMTQVFRVSGNKVYQGTIFGPDVVFSLDIVGEVDMEDYKQVEETIMAAWMQKNAACQCQYLTDILHGTKYTGKNGLQLTRVYYTVSRNGRRQPTSSPEKPALEDFVASFNSPSGVFELYPWTDAISYDLRFEAALAEVASLTSLAGVARGQALIAAWTRYLQENGQCVVAGCNVTIRYGKLEEHYTNNSNQISNLIYFVTLNNNYINRTSISGPYLQGAGPSLASCICQSLPVLSLDLHGHVSYFMVMSVITDIVGNDSIVIRREYGYDASVNLVTHVVFKPAYFNTIIPDRSDKDLRAISLKHQVKAMNRSMPVRRRYQLVLEGTVDSCSTQDLDSMLQQAWTTNNKDLVTDELILSIVKVDFKSSVKTDGSPVTVIDYTVSVGTFDSSLTIVEAPSLSLLQASVTSRENLTLCDCEIRIKRNITTTGSFKEGNDSLSRLQVALQQAWVEANEGYTGNITVLILPTEPREEQVANEVKEGTEESTRKEEIVFNFIVNPSEGQPGVTDLDMSFPEASVINKYFILYNLDLTVVEEGESSKEYMFPWYIPAGVVLGLVITGMMIFMFYRILEDQKNAEKMPGSEDPKDFMEDSDNGDLSIQPVAFENLAINNGANSRKYSTRYSISSDYDGQTVL